MFSHLFRYRIVSLLRSKVIVFWSLVYPIVLGILFFLAFGSSVGKRIEFSTTKVAVVTESVDQITEHFVEVMSEIAYDGSGKMFEVTECSREEALKLLADKKIIGVITLNNDITIEVGGKGIYESIIKEYCDTFRRTTSLYNDVASYNPAAITEVQKAMNSEVDYIRNVSLGGETQDGLIQYFYALVAMACLFGCFIGMQVGKEVQASSSPVAARKVMSSAHRFKVILADMLAAFVIDFIEVMLVVLFLQFVLGLNIVSQPLLFTLVCFFGSLIGVSSGQFFSCVAKGKDGLQICLSLIFSLISSALGGLMAGDVKNIIEQNVPIINRINPSSLISDAFFSLSVYSDYKRFTLNIVILAAEAIVFTVCSYMSVRRLRYASL